MPAVPQQAASPPSVPPPGTPQHGRRSPSPRLWRMRCAEVAGCAAVLAAVVGTGAGLAAGPAVAVIAVAAVAVGAAAALWFARNRFRSWAYQERDEDLI